MAVLKSCALLHILYNKLFSHTLLLLSLCSMQNLFLFFFYFLFFSNMSTLACISELHIGEEQQSNKRKDTSMLMCRFLLVWVLSDVEPVKAISSYGKLLCWSAKLNYLSTLSLCCHFDFFQIAETGCLARSVTHPRGHRVNDTSLHISPFHHFSLQEVI